MLIIWAISAAWMLSAGMTSLLAAGPAEVTRVPLQINEASADRAVPWPVTTGVPFARGQLAGAELVRLVDDQGHAQPLQARTTATWDAGGSSVRWLTIDFLAQPGRQYALELGPVLQRAVVVSPLRIEKDAQTITVHTGPLRAVFSATGPAPLREVWADLGHGEMVKLAGGAADGQHYYVDQHGQRFTCARDDADRKIVVECAGPVRTCIRVDGFYTGPHGERLVAYRTRYHFYAHLSLVKVCDEFRILGSTASMQWQDIGFALDVTLAAAGRTVQVQRSSAAAEGLLAIPWTADTQAVSSYQQTYRHVGNLDIAAGVAVVNAAGTQTLSAPERVGPWMQMADQRAAITGSLRWFWQQFPKEWTAQNQRLTLHLWSPRGGLLDLNTAGALEFLGPAGQERLIDRPKVADRTKSPVERYKDFGGFDQVLRKAVDGQGIAKHHEFYLHFGAAPTSGDSGGAPGSAKPQAAGGVAYAQLADQPPLALASGAWNTGTDVLGPLLARPNAFPQYEAIVDRLFDLSREAQHEYGDYGWWFFGCGPHYSYAWDETLKRHYVQPVRFEFHTYQRDVQHWWNYLRSGERKFLDWALPSENHWVDIAVAHVPMTYACDWHGGDAQPGRVMHWRPGDWSTDGPIHYLRHHDTAEAWLRGGAQFWASYHRSLETTTLAYYLTGDERYAEVIGYWRDYWAGLAGVHSGSADVAPWYREQAWFAPGIAKPQAAPGTQGRESLGFRGEKTWAQMIRDYAPFQSGSRHQLSLFFNLATLYEHTWDPAIGQVLREYADAFMDLNHPIGVWRTHENSLPANAEVPAMAHYWAPALWKYARVTGDPRMPEVFRRYFGAAYGADPIRSDVGNYSDTHPAYAYALTGDPRHLRFAAAALRELLPLAQPLANPNDWRSRLFNPYTPIQAFAAVPRLLWALDQARQRGQAVNSDVDMPLQRTAIALCKRAGEPLHAELWSFDRTLTILDPDGAPVTNAHWKTQTNASAVQPFDRVMPDFASYLHELELDTTAPAGFYILTPRLETAVLSTRGVDAVLANATRPLAVESNQTWSFRAAPIQTKLGLRATPGLTLQLRGPAGPVAGQAQGSDVLYALEPGATYMLTNTANRAGYFQMIDVSAAQAWFAQGRPLPPQFPPLPDLAAGALPPTLSFDPDATFVPGPFPNTQALLITAARTVQLPDHLPNADVPQRLFDTQQGTLECWVQRLWDDRLAASRRVTFLDNGIVSAWDARPLPLGEWTHIAVTWHPTQRDPSRVGMHVYVNGVDYANYRSIWWDGYGQSMPTVIDQPAKWLRHFVLRSPQGIAFAIADLRITARALHVPAIDLSAQQVINPVRFAPPTQPLVADSDTLLLYPLNGNLTGSAPRTGATLTGQLLANPSRAP